MHRHGADNLDYGRTAAFITISFAQKFHAFNCRSMKQGIFKLGFLTNRSLVMAVVISGIVQLSAVYLPILQPVFKTKPLFGIDLLIVVLLSLSPLVFGEFFKRLRRGGERKMVAVR